MPTGRSFWGSGLVEPSSGTAFRGGVQSDCPLIAHRARKGQGLDNSTASKWPQRCSEAAAGLAGASTQRLIEKDGETGQGGHANGHWP